MSQEKVLLENSVVVKLAKPSDMLDVFDLVDNYEGTIPLNVERTKDNLRDIVYGAGVLLGEYNGEVFGGIAGYALPCLFNDEVMYVAMFFYVKKDYRHLTKKFLKEVELVLLPTSVTQIILSLPHGASHDKLQRYLSMLGYNPLETHMIKRVIK